MPIADRPLPADWQPSLIAALERVNTHSWQNFQATLTIAHAETFIEEIIQLATEIPHPSIVEYANTLSQGLDLFDWELLPKLIADFADFKRTLIATLVEDR
jgi:hypothetical protein